MSGTLVGVVRMERTRGSLGTAIRERGDRRNPHRFHVDGRNVCLSQHVRLKTLALVPKHAGESAKLVTQKTNHVPKRMHSIVFIIIFGAHDGLERFVQMRMVPFGRAIRHRTLDEKRSRPTLDVAIRQLQNIIFIEKQNSFGVNERYQFHLYYENKENGFEIYYYNRHAFIYF